MEYKSMDTSNELEPQNNSNRQLFLDSDQSTSKQESENDIQTVADTKNFLSHVQKVVSEESFVQRRVSPRLKNIPESKRPYYGTSRRDLFRHSKDKNKEEHVNDNHFIQKSSPNVSRKGDVDKICKSEPNNQGSRSDLGNSNEATCSAIANNGKIDSKIENSKCLGGCNSSCNTDGKSAYARVKETLRIYNSHYLRFVQERQKKSKERKVHNRTNAKGRKRKKEDATEDVKHSSSRPDLKAVSMMLEMKAILYPKKRFGHLPGIDVGYQFYSRSEMVAVGFHAHWLNGIDYMGKTYSKMKEYKGYTFPLAVAIVLSGQYEDDLDNLEDVWYTGQGGNDLLGDKRQFKDQEMSRGNLALKNNMEQSVSVRVVRGHKSDPSYGGKIYTYDGLYEVVQLLPEKGASGFVVYKYRLVRVEGQPKLTTNQVHFSHARGLKASSKLPGLVSEDISGGQEDVHIPSTNLIDDTPVSPTGFTYSKSIQVAENIILPPDAEGCSCKGKCTNAKACACARLNGTDFPYVRLNGGRLIEAKDVVFECGPNCLCGPDCINRISQRGMKYQLEVFRTPNKGWAVRSRVFIPSGAPVCEYIGMLRRTDDLDNVAENDYIFEIDCLHTMKGIGGRERRSVDASAQVSNQLEKIDDKTLESTPEFCIDAGPVGNVARFINHSCEPNLFVQCVLSSHHDVRLARVVLFAAESIPPFQELTYDYGYGLDSVIGPDGKVKELPCHCGAAGCRKRLY